MTNAADSIWVACRNWAGHWWSLYSVWACPGSRHTNSRPFRGTERAHRSRHRDTWAQILPPFRPIDGVPAHRCATPSRRPYTPHDASGSPGDHCTEPESGDIVSDRFDCRYRTLVDPCFRRIHRPWRRTRIFSVNGKKKNFSYHFRNCGLLTFFLKATNCKSLRPLKAEIWQ